LERELPQTTDQSKVVLFTLVSGMLIATLRYHYMGASSIEVVSLGRNHMVRESACENVWFGVRSIWPRPDWPPANSQRLNRGKPLGTGYCEWLWSIGTVVKWNAPVIRTVNQRSFPFFYPTCLLCLVHTVRNPKMTRSKK